MQLRVHALVTSTRAEGPGLRSALWVQGCSLRCPGCSQPASWPVGAGRAYSLDEAEAALTRDPAIEGVTFLGGEPFEQAPALALLAERVRPRGLSVMTFTGYTLDQLGKLQGSQALLAATDLLVDGPYRQDQPDTRRPWVGSSNQRFHFLTERYRHLEHQLATLPNRVEIRLGPDGSVQLNGMASLDGLQAWLAAAGLDQR